MKFRLEKDTDLSPRLFSEYPVWAQYYSPEDIENIVLEGYEKAEVESVLSASGYSDEYVFPVLNHQRKTPYMFTMYACVCAFPNREEYSGYVYVTKYAGINSISIYCNEEYIPLNMSNPEVTEDEELELKRIISADAIFPLMVNCTQLSLVDKLYNPYKKYS